MEWETTLRKIKRLIGCELKSITGRTNIRLISISADKYMVETERRTILRPITELQKVVAAMSLNYPIHVESILLGSRSSRSHPETILAALPDVEWLRIDGVKHVVWTGKSSHKLGTLKEKSD